MKPKKFNRKPMYQTELKQQICILKILEGEKNKREEKESLSPNSGA